MLTLSDRRGVPDQVRGTAARTLMVRAAVEVQAAEAIKAHVERAPALGARAGGGA